MDGSSFSGAILFTRDACRSQRRRILCPSLLSKRPARTSSGRSAILSAVWPCSSVALRAHSAARRPQVTAPSQDHPRSGRSEMMREPQARVAQSKIRASMPRRLAASKNVCRVSCDFTIFLYGLAGLSSERRTVSWRVRRVLHHEGGVRRAAIGESGPLVLLSRRDRACLAAIPRDHLFRHGCRAGSPGIRRRDPWIRARKPWIRRLDPWIRRRDPWIRCRTPLDPLSPQTGFLSSSAGVSAAFSAGGASTARFRFGENSRRVAMGRSWGIDGSRSCAPFQIFIIRSR